jgi:hypothetical protein
MNTRAEAPDCSVPATVRLIIRPPCGAYTQSNVESGWKTLGRRRQHVNDLQGACGPMHLRRFSKRRYRSMIRMCRFSICNNRPRQGLTSLEAILTGVHGMHSGAMRRTCLFGLLGAGEWRGYDHSDTEKARRSSFQKTLRKHNRRCFVQKTTSTPVYHLPHLAISVNRNILVSIQSFGGRGCLCGAGFPACLS